MDMSSNSQLSDLSSTQKRALLAELLRKKFSKAQSYPLSFTQQGLWFLYQLTPDNPFYNASCTITITGPLQKRVLEQSLSELVRWHQILRTRFELREEHPVQLIDPARPIALPVGDLTLLSSEVRAAEVPRANRLAHRLRRLGVRSEMLVGLCLQRSIEMIIGLLGILKAGGAYVPLDPGYPIEQIEYMLQDAQVPVLLTTNALSQRIAQHHSQPLHLICLESAYEYEQLLQQSTNSLTRDSQSDNLAYVIYTSGSTGRPKGVQITHRGLTNLINWHRQNFAVTAQDRATQLASISFDAAVWEIWPYLTVRRNGLHCSR